ncbi:hypothetical protein N0V88_005279 [Collariella sp. IMI 366227]|nr:hypothetical protein N0V88_005279 [Collariella sp. IMI 366227]
MAYLESIVYVISTFFVGYASDLILWFFRLAFDGRGRWRQLRYDGAVVDPPQPTENDTAPEEAENRSGTPSPELTDRSRTPSPQPAMYPYVLGQPPSKYTTSGMHRPLPPRSRYGRATVDASDARPKRRMSSSAEMRPVRVETTA